MFKYIEPLYKNNMILTAQLLQEHTGYSCQVLQNAYIDYADGIISGVDVQITDTHIQIMPGLIKHNQILYSLNEKIQLPYEHKGIETFLRIRFLDAVEREGSIYHETELVLSEDATEFPYEMELGRFTAAPGATLYKNVTDFSKLSVAYDNFDIRYVRYAAPRVSTVSPVITTLFGKALLDRRTTDVYDVAFAMQCMSGQTIAREVIENYIQIKTNRRDRELTNEQIYQEFVQILKQPVTQGRFLMREQPLRRVVVD